MNRVFKFVMSLVLVLSILSLNIAYATEAEPTRLPETIHNNGQVHVVIDTETNRPADFYDYNFYVNFVNSETGEWITKTIHYSLNYNETIDLPFGKYEIGEAGVEKDYLGKFALIGGEAFELNGNNKSAEIYLGFPEAPIIAPTETPQPSPTITQDPVVEPTAPVINEPIDSMGSITWFINTEEQPMGGMEVTLYIVDNYNIEKFIVLNEDNGYKNTIELPAGVYKVNQDKTTIQNNDNLTCMLDGESIQLDNNSNIECQVYPCEREQTETDENEKGAFALSKGITVGSGIVLLAVIAVGLWQIKKYI